jgi:hypothetical protein
MTIDVVLICSSPAALRTQMINRGILKDDGQGGLVGVLGGTEFTATGIPNPVVATLGPPPTYDTRKVYLLRLSHEADANDDDGSATAQADPTPRYTRSKLVAWVMANSVAETLTGADGVTYRTRRHTSNTLWFVVPADMAKFGAWQ